MYIHTYLHTKCTTYVHIHIVYVHTYYTVHYCHSCNCVIMYNMYTCGNCYSIVLYVCLYVHTCAKIYTHTNSVCTYIHAYSVHTYMMSEFPQCLWILPMHVCMYFPTQGHHLAVYSLRWNPFHSSVFASCGADWSVKIWDNNMK